MVHIDAVRSANASLVKTKPFVAVVCGGTAGIGECAVRQLATTFKDQPGNCLRVYVVGRSTIAAEKIISGCQRECPSGQFRFLGGDLSLIKEVDRVCAEVIECEQSYAKAQGYAAKIDLLVLCQGQLSFGGRVETEDGLDKHMSLFYYSRMRFAVKLLPLLVESPLGGRVVSVMNPRLQGKMATDDLSLRKPGNFTFRYVTSHVANMNSFFLEQLASRNPGKISASHYYPGHVKTNIVNKGSLPWWARFIFNYITGPFTGPFTVPLDECGQRILFMASTRYPPRSAGAISEAEAGTDGQFGSGAYNVNRDGETFVQSEECKKLREGGVGAKIWQHTMEAFETIEAGKVFSG